MSVRVLNDLLVQFVGYDNYKVQDLEIKSETGSLNLGALKLASASTELDEGVVEGAEVRRLVETTLDGMTIHPEMEEIHPWRMP